MGGWEIISRCFETMESECVSLDEFQKAVRDFQFNKKSRRRGQVERFALVQQRTHGKRKKSWKSREYRPVLMIFDCETGLLDFLVDNGKGRRRLLDGSFWTNPIGLLIISMVAGVLVWVLTTLMLSKAASEEPTSARSTLCSDDFESDSDPVIEGTLSRVASFLSR